MPDYRPWMNAVLYQGIWFVCVLGREGLVLLAFALLALHVALCRDRRTEITLMLAAAVFGVIVDSALTLGGVFVFNPPASLLPVPLWLVAIWLAFAGTFRHALEFFVDRLPLAIVAGGIGGPLSYFAAGRLGAVTMPLGTWPSITILAVVWAVNMFVLVMLARTLDRRSATIAPP